MEIVNQPEVWRAIFVMLGSAAAGLVGLLFVVMSFHLDGIKKHPDNVVPARNNTLHLLTVLVVAVLVLTPQPLSILGAELVVINLFGLRLPIGITYGYFRKNIGFSFRDGFPKYTIVTIVGAYLLGIAGGVGLIEHANWALYLVTASLLHSCRSFHSNSLEHHVWSALRLMAHGRRRRRDRQRRSTIYQPVIAPRLAVETSLMYLASTPVV